MTTLIEDIAKQLCMADHDGVLVWDRMEEAQVVWLEEARRLLARINQHPETLERRTKDFDEGWKRAKAAEKGEK